MRLTDLIRGAKTISDESDEAKKKAAPTAQPETTSSSQALEEPARSPTPISSTPPITSSEADAPPDRSWPKRPMDEPRPDEFPRESEAGAGQAIRATRLVPTQSDMTPVGGLSATGASPQPPPIRLSQPASKPSPPKADDAGAPQIELRALGRLSKRAGGESQEPRPHESDWTPPAAKAEVPDVVTSVTPAPPIPTPLTYRETPPAWGTIEEPDRQQSEGPASARQADVPTVEPIPATPAPKINSVQIDWYGLATEEVTRIAGLVRNRRPFELDGIQRIAEGIVESMQDNDDLLIKAFAARTGSLLVTNMVNVAVFVAKLGKGMGYHSNDLVRLVMAGLLHDVGMFLLPDSLILRAGKLTKDEEAALRQHPEMGQQILGKLGPQYDWLAQVAHQEHERASGRGYPRGLRESQIHEFAKIVGLADVFEALLNPRPHRPRMLPHVAMRELLATERQSFPHQLLKVMVEQFSVFPLGTPVRLSTGEIGVVTKLNPRHPLRPVVRITQLPDRTMPSDSKLVDLSTTTLVHVAVVETESL